MKHLLLLLLFSMALFAAPMAAQIVADENPVTLTEEELQLAGEEIAFQFEDGSELLAQGPTDTDM